MTNSKASFLIFGFICTFLQLVQGQSNEKYLYSIGIEESLYSDVLDETRTIWVQLPEEFDPESSTRYPVVYILDGGVQMDALTTVYNYYRGHHLPEMILIGISNRNNRTRDLTTSAVTYRNGFKVNEETGGAEAFTQFISKELIPFIESKYPTTTFRTLIGHSYGGLFAINIFLNHTELFENYIAVDPSLDWDNQKLLKQAKEELQNKDLAGKSLFVSLAAGQLHMLNGEITLDNVMQDTSEYTLFGRSIIDFAKFAEKHNSLDFAWKTYPTDYHWTLPLPSIQDGLIEQFEWYQLKSATKYSNPETSLGELIELVKEREKILSDHFGYSIPPLVEELFNQTGYMYLQFGQTEKAYAFFKMGTEYYPESANVYDSMADYYETQNDFTNALKYVTKAFQLSGNDYYKQRMKDLESRK